MFLSFPYNIDFRGMTATSDLQDYVAGMLRLMLLTSPGECINRPSFGGGVEKFVFAAMNGQMINTTETFIRSALTQWMSDVISVQSLSVAAVDDTLTIAIS